MLINVLIENTRQPDSDNPDFGHFFFPSLDRPGFKCIKIAAETIWRHRVTVKFVYWHTTGDKVERSFELAWVSM